MREFFNAILTFIVAESLTDDEFETCTSVMPIYDQGSYDDLASVLESRGSISTLQDRLLAYYQAKGVSITPADTGKSDILIGCEL